MNPDEPKPANDVSTSAPEFGTPPVDPNQSSVPPIETTVTPSPLPAEPNVPTMTDTISPDVQPSQPVQPTNSQVSENVESPAGSGVINGTSPITETVPAQPSAEDPGHKMGIVGLVLAFFMAPVGLIVSIIARSKSKKAGHKNGIALAGIIISIVNIIAGIALIALVWVGLSATVEFCNTNGSGTHTTEDGVTIRCD